MVIKTAVMERRAEIIRGTFSPDSEGTSKTRRAEIKLYIIPALTVAGFVSLQQCTGIVRNKV
jgi:hypothetical protein